MIEAEARAWVMARHGVSRGTLLGAFVEAVAAEARTQNLISRSSVDHLWFRHIVDSAQLLDHATPAPGLWVDIGTGAGFPGMVIALLSDRRVMLVEPRRRRAEFLQRIVDDLALGNRVTVHRARIEAVTTQAAFISARAVAALPDLLRSAHHLAGRDTLWLLPKGKSAREEVAAAQRSWHGVFHVEQSITEPDSLLVIAKGVRPK